MKHVGMRGFVLAAAVAGGACAAQEAAPGNRVFTSDIGVLATGLRFTEGPLWHRDGYVLFSDIPANHIYRLDPAGGEPQVWREDSGQSNGLTVDGEGRLVACEHGNRRVSRTEPDGRITVIADRYQGKRFNSPNDCVIRTDGMVFFTDPPYGLGKRPRELDVNGVFRVLPGADPVLLATDFDRPNGIALSPDEKTLYVADTQQHHVRAFALAADGSVEGGRVLAEMRNPDGMKVDREGRLYVTSRDGVAVFAADGTRLTVLAFPQVPANCAFGGADARTLFVTARTGVYSVRTAGPGLVPWR